jgi:hypothetical protein
MISKPAGKFFRHARGQSGEFFEGGDKREEAEIGYPSLDNDKFWVPFQVSEGIQNKSNSQPFMQGEDDHD